MEPVLLLRSQRLPQWPVASIGNNMFPGRKPTPAVETRSVDHRKQLHYPNSDPETDMFPGRRPTPAAEPPECGPREALFS